MNQLKRERIVYHKIYFFCKFKLLQINNSKTFKTVEKVTKKDEIVDKKYFYHTK